MCRSIRMRAPFVLSLVAIVAAWTSTRAHRATNERNLNSQIKHNQEWQKYFASPVATPVHSHSALGSGENDPDLEGPGHVRIVSPELESVIKQALAGGGHAASSSSTSSSSSKKGKHKSKGKGGHSVESEFDDDFFDHYNGSEPRGDDDDKHSSKSTKGKGLKKKSSKTSSGNKKDCYYVNGIYIGIDCDEVPSRRSKLHKKEESPHSPPSNDAPSPVTYPPNYPPSYVAPPPIYASPAAVPPSYTVPSAPSPPTISIPSFFTPRPDHVPVQTPESAPARPIFEGNTVAPITPVSPSSPVTTVAPVLTPVSGPSEDETAGPSPALPATSTPTSAPVLGLVDARPAYRVKTVTPDPILIRITGTFDPDTQEEAFFEVVRTNFAPYSRASVGVMLTKIDLTAEFITGRPGAPNVPSGVTTSWSEIRVSYYVGTDDPILFDAFTPESASMLLAKFFKPPNLKTLIQRLGEAGISVLTIEVHQHLPSDGSGQTKEDEDTKNPDPVIKPKQAEATSDKHGAVIAATVCGSIILLAIGAVLAKKHQAQKHSIFDEKASITSDHSLTDVYSGTPGGMYVTASESARNIKPAALHIRNKRERENEGKVKLSSDSTISSYQSNGTTNAERADKVRKSSKTNEVTKAKTEETTAIVPYADGSDPTAARALKCLDGEESVGALNDAYPEFDLYHSAGLAPPSPGWSVGNFSSTSRPHGSEDGDYVSSRKRWHDEANDLDLIALPDHSSDLGYASAHDSHYSRSGSDDESEANSKDSHQKCSI